MVLIRRTGVAGGRPALSREDLYFCLQLPLLFLIAWLVPERWWPGFSHAIENAKARIGVFSPDRVIAALTQALPGIGGADARRLAIRHAARRGRHHLEILRSYRPGGWRLPIRLEGEEKVRRALAGGKGAVLWVAHFSSNALATKIAFSRAGFRVWHVSRPEHGFSKSRFGIRWLNPIRIRGETRYLAGRIEIDREHPAKAMVAARRRLAAGDFVSITAGAWEGRTVVPARLLGGTLELAVGAPRLSLLTGAPLLPVITVHDPAIHGIRVIVAEALALPGGGESEDAIAALTQAFVDQTSCFIREYPDQWRDWNNLRFG